MIQFFQKKGASTELAELLVTLLDAAAEIASSVVVTSTGKAGSHNSFGEEQIAMDVAAEHLIESRLRACPFVAAFCSEELDALQKVHADGRFSVFYDPLDGSSLFDANFSVGTIVGIFEGAEVLGRTCREQVAAFYAMYGPRTTVMCTVGSGVFELTLLDGVWVVSAPEVQLRGDKKYFAPGNLRATADRPDYFALVTDLMKEQYTLRYTGGMVPDINHIFKKGSGIFMYPGTPKEPQGKLRLLYECGPMAMLMEQAGGAASTGEQAVLDLPITDYTQRTPILIGQKEDVERAVKALA